MKRIFLSAVVVFLFAGLASAGTFTIQNTFIPVPTSAMGTDAGDTSSASNGTIQLDARVYIPDGATSPVPVVVVMHGFAGSKTDGRVVALAMDFATNGYVVLTPTVRGFGNSEGKVSLVGPNEVNDLKTIILAMQTGTIGDVAIPVTTQSLFGVTGVSYGGGHSFEIARTHVAGLAAVAPIIGWSDLYQALAPNDVPKLAFTAGLFGGGIDPQNPTYSSEMFDWLGDLLSGRPERTRTGNPQANIDWRSVIFDPAELTVPMFVIQGWRDWLFPTEQAISLFNTNTACPFFKLYLGGLGHPPATADITNPEALFLRAQLVRWFDQWLKGVDTGLTGEVRVTVAPERTANWVEAELMEGDTFPLPGTTTNTYFINHLRLSTDVSAGKPRTVKQTGIPILLQPIFGNLGNTTALLAALAAANDLLNSGGSVLDDSIVTTLDSDANGRNFTSFPLAQPLQAQGVPAVHLFVSASRSNAVYFVQIQERLADGGARLVTRGAFRDHASNFRTPHEIDFQLFGVNHVFEVGSKIRLRITSRDFPFFLPNLNQPTITIFRDAGHPSSLTLPVAP